MSVFETIEKRYSVRGFEDREIEEEKLNKILEAARLAPTATNNQAFKIYVVDTKKHINQLDEVSNFPWLKEAPLILVVVSVDNEAWTRKWDAKNHGEIDATIIMDHIILEATDLGLGTCYIAAFYPKALSKLLNLSEQEHPVLMTPIGYPNAEPRGTDRKSLDEIVKYV